MQVLDKSVNIHKAKSTLSQLIARAEAGEEVLLARNGKVVARLTRVIESKPRLPWGALRGKITMLDTFDDPLEEMKDYV